MKQTDTQSWYRAMARTSRSWELWVKDELKWHNSLAMNQIAPSKCDHMFAEYHISALL